MSWIDILIIIILAGGLIEGLLRGLIKEVIGVASVAAGIFVARICGDDVTAWLAEDWEVPVAIASALSYALVFTVISAAFSFAAHILSSLVQAARLNTINRLLGGVAGFAKGLIITLMIVFALSKLDEFKPFISEETKSQSKLYEPAVQLSHACLSITRSQFREEGKDALLGD